MRGFATSLLCALLLVVFAPGCARIGKLSFVDPISPVVPADIAKAQDSSRVAAGLDRERRDRRQTPDSRPGATTQRGAFVSADRKSLVLRLPAGEER